LGNRYIANELPQDRIAAAVAAVAAVEHLYQQVLKVSIHFDKQKYYELIRKAVHLLIAFAAAAAVGYHCYHGNIRLRYCHPGCHGNLNKVH
jgi:hypothetical protein